ncbi:MAG TPA: UDP-glucose 4-epimerase GalE [Syntrophales bacterium]|jgi:UDP-glucose 4-epimerase|nr:UDP-glucose 4-epimerase GalE [Syntrophales bacterium]HQA83220.1 UDP-glucose 4-epimerase GalE [Syntrophales bacterium]
MKILVTGGAGYIGSHVVKALGEKGHKILVYDNLSTGHPWAVLYGELAVGDLADPKRLGEVMAGFLPEAVIHFAASIQVEESVRKPLAYYRNNVVNSLNLLEAMQACGVHRLIYSSSAAVYGNPETSPVDETAPMKPINPYGATKMIMEQVLGDLDRAGGIHYAALRYFNVAGADAGGRIGQAYAESTHLITRALKVAKGEIPLLNIYGTDYPTPDGTCIRDYIHVDDLAQAHVLALEYLVRREKSVVLNCGYGHGFSVRQVVDAVRRVTGISIEVVEAERRSGDPAALVADSGRIRALAGWTPQCDDLDFIIRTAWDWEKQR